MPANVDMRNAFNENANANAMNVDDSPEDSIKFALLQARHTSVRVAIVDQFLRYVNDNIGLRGNVTFVKNGDQFHTSLPVVTGGTALKYHVDRLSIMFSLQQPILFQAIDGLFTEDIDIKFYGWGTYKYKGEAQDELEQQRNAVLQFLQNLANKNVNNVQIPELHTTGGPALGFRLRSLLGVFSYDNRVVQRGIVDTTIIIEEDLKDEVYGYYDYHKFFYWLGHTPLAEPFERDPLMPVFASVRYLYIDTIKLLRKSYEIVARTANAARTHMVNPDMDATQYARQIGFINAHACKLGRYIIKFYTVAYLLYGHHANDIPNIPKLELTNNIASAMELATGMVDGFTNARSFLGTFEAIRNFFDQVNLQETVKHVQGYPVPNVVLKALRGGYAFKGIPMRSKKQNTNTSNTKRVIDDFNLLNAWQFDKKFIQHIYQSAINPTSPLSTFLSKVFQGFSQPASNIAPTVVGGGKRKSFDKMTVKELKALAKTRNIKGFSKQNKEMLIASLRKKRTDKT